MSIVYIPKSLASQVATLPVLCIHASAHPPTALVDASGSQTGQKTNHWVLYLASSKTESLRLDPSPGPNGEMTLIVSQKSYLYSSNAVKTVQLSTVKHLNAGTVIDYLRSSKYVQYRFSNSGQGCRYWIESVVSLLSSVEYITGSIDEARVALQFVWDPRGKASETEQSGIIAGEFYARGGGRPSSRGLKNWSEWIWREQYNCYERYCYDHNGEVEYDYWDPQK